MPNSIRKIFEELDRRRDDGDESGIERYKTKEESVKRFHEHLKLCKENLKNWRLD